MGLVAALMGACRPLERCHSRPDRRFVPPAESLYHRPAVQAPARQLGKQRGSGMKKTFPLVPAILTLAAFGILCSLGVWQIQRLQWKERMLSDLHAAYETGALPILSAE